MVRVGVAGWDYPDWSGVVYPTASARRIDHLSYISRFVDVVEINSTFYRPAEPRVAASWVRRTAERRGFRFTAKVHRSWTHDPRADPAAAITPTLDGLRPLLEAFGHHPRLRLVLFTVDEDTFSRELAPIAGVYPAVRLGAPWWFLDTPDAMRRFREAVTDTAGFYNTTGFVDDTRAFLSIPARHDLARRIDAGFLARMVAEHRLELDEAMQTAHDLAYGLPKASYPPLLLPSADAS